MNSKRLQKKNEKWLSRYGVSYSEVQDKVNSKKKTNFVCYKKILNENKKYKKIRVWQALLGLVLSVFTVFEAVLFERMINYLTISEWHNAIMASIMVGVVILCCRGLSHIYSIWGNNTRLSLSHKLRMQMVNSVMNTKTKKFDIVSTGQVINRVVGDANGFSDATMKMVDSFNFLLRGLIYMAYALYLNIWLGLILFGMGFFAYIWDRVYTLNFRKYYTRRNMMINDKMTSVQSEMVRGVRDVKVLGVKDNLIERVLDVSQKKNRAQMDNTKVRQWYWNIRVFFNVLFLVTFLVVGIYFVQMGWESLSVFLVLMMYRSNIIGFFEELGILIGNKQDAENRAERMLEVLDEKEYPKESYGNIVLDNPKGEIEFKNVRFRYSEDKKLFEKLNFKIKANECVGFVGKSGEGKSTIINLLPRLYEPQSGKIKIDNVDIKELAEESLRKCVGVVQQTPYIFNMSIKENLLFAKMDATDEEIISACQQAQIHNFIDGLPNKYDEIVGEGGLTLSGGQRQRLAIARTLLQDNKIIIFDEATSALDNESQENIKKAINELKRNKTILIVAHRLTTVRDCDRIFVLDKNDVVADGTHKELMENCKIYQNLYKAEEGNN